jgi:hypothetical protein
VSHRGISERQSDRQSGIEDSEITVSAHSVLAVLTAQVGVLGLLLSGSVYLQTLSVSSAPKWGADGWVMLLLGVAYLVLAYGLWGLQRWVHVCSVITLVTVLIAGIVGALGYTPMDLGFMLVIFLCCSINLAIIGWFYWSRMAGKSS